MSEQQQRIARYVAAGIPAATAVALVSYEMSHQGHTSTIGTNGERMTA